MEGGVVVDPDGALTGLGVLVDVDPREEGQVEQAAGAVVGFQVGSVAVAGQVEHFGEAGTGFVVAGGGGGQFLFDVRQSSADPFLLGLEEVEWDRSGVVGVEQLLTLGGEFDALPAE